MDKQKTYAGVIEENNNVGVIDEYNGKVDGGEVEPPTEDEWHREMSDRHIECEHEQN